MEFDQIFPFVVLSILVCLVTGLKQWLLGTITDFDADQILTRGFGIAVRIGAVVLLVLVLLGSWKVAAILLSAPCFWALGSLMRPGPRGSRRMVAVRRIPSPASVPGFGRKQELAMRAKSVARYVLFLVLLYWLIHR